MQASVDKLDEFLGHVLRGAAKILGCNSTNLVVIHEKSRNMRVRLGAAAVNNPLLAELETVMGDSFRGLAVSLDRTLDSLIYQVWRDGSMRETSRLSELVGSAFPAEVTEQLERMIGEHRFILAPAVGTHHNYGVLLFEKDGVQPFSRQQKEVLLRYARRIGAIIENDMMGQRLAALRPPAGEDEFSLEHQLLQLTLDDPAPTVFVDPALRVTSCNEAAGKLFGRDVESMTGRALRELFREPDALLEGIGSQLPGVGSPFHDSPGVIRRKDGSLSSTRIESLQLVDDTDQVVGYLLLLHGDGGAETWSPERLVRQERLATMGEMAAQLAHEIRNPLLAIGATLESLVREARDPRQERLLTSAAREITRLDMILRKHLSPRQDLARTQVSLGGLLADVRRLLSGTRKQAGKTISLRIENGATVRGDYDALKHVFFNLILNALEASPPGGEVVCRTEDNQEDVSVFVEDRGPGLTAEAQRCFEPFFTTKKNGTGLGLVVCQKMAQAHGGVVHLRDRQGGGCQAVVVLPRRRG